MEIGATRVIDTLVTDMFVRELEHQLPADLIGSPAFFPGLLNYIRTASNSPTVPLDDAILKSILLCIVAGDKHLILRTPEEDIGLVVKLVCWTLAYVFSYPTQKVKLRSYSSSTSTNSFLWSLFLPANQGNGSQDDVHKQTPRGQKTGRPASRGLAPDYPRSSSYPNDLAQASVHLRRSSSTFSPHSNRQDGEPKFAGTTFESDGPPLSNSPPPVVHSYTDPASNRSKFSHQDNQDLLESLELPRALVLSGLERTSDSVQRALVQMISDKRITLADLDGDSQSAQITQHHDYASQPGTFNSRENEPACWPLPSGFIVIYVCPIDTKERPAIHRSLLDRFAMSNNIQLSQTIRYALRATPVCPNPAHPYSASYSETNSPLLAFHSPLPQGHVQTPPYFTKPLPTATLSRQGNLSSSSIFTATPQYQPPEKPILPTWFIDTLRKHHRKTCFAPTLALYLSDLFSAVRHHQRLDGTLLTASARKDAEDLARAARVIGVDHSGMELIRPPGHLKDEGDDGSDYYSFQDVATLHALAPGMHSPQMSRQAYTLPSGDESSMAPLLGKDSASVFTNAYSYTRSPVKGAGPSDTHNTSTAQIRGSTRPSEIAATSAEIEVLDVTEGDVARIVPRVVTHRLRLRDGPEEEVLASVIVGATFSRAPSADTRNRRPSSSSGIEAGDFEYESGLGGYGSLGIKDILVDILNKV